MKLFKIIGLILVLSPLGQAFGVDQETLGRLHENDPSLTTLDLFANQIAIGDPGTVALAEALKVNTSLTTLKLYYMQIGPAGAIALAEALEVNTSLTLLELDRNQIGDEGTTALAEALKVNTSLTTLDLSDNHFGDEGARALADALKVNTSLTELTLSCNQIGPAGAHALAGALRTNTSLTHLDLMINQIGPAGAAALAEALKVNTSLTTFSLFDNQIRAALRQEIARLMSPEGIQERRRVLVPWSIPRHLQLVSWNPHVAPVVNTILLLEVRSRTQDLFVTDAQGRTVRLPPLPPEMWHKILGYLRCGDFGPRALPAP